jgi:hypothetical protein
MTACAGRQSGAFVPALMRDINEGETTMSNNTTTSKRPTHTAYSVRDYTKNSERKADWVRVGVAFAHRDGEGFDVILDAIPTNGRIAIRKNRPRPVQA